MTSFGNSNSDEMQKERRFSHLPGHLRVNMGPMFASKTQVVTDNLNRYADLGFPTAYINTIQDTRSDSGVSTHNSGGNNLSKKVDKFPLQNLKEFNPEKYKVIGVDEGQFFSDLCDVILEWTDVQQKIVHVVGLDLNAKRQKWGQLTELSAHADICEKMTAKCVDCLSEGKGILNAPFTSRLDPSGPEIDIGGHDKYIACCRLHWNLRNPKN